MSRTVLAGALLLSFVVHFATGVSTIAAESQSGKPVSDFRLNDAAGKPLALADLKDAKLVAIVFLGAECPLARLYAPRLNELAAAYADKQVKFIGIDANVQDTPADIAKYVDDLQVKFPVLKDTGNVVADQLGAARTPEVFLLDAERKVRYQGRIDGQYLPGVQRTTNPRKDLAIAIDELLEGKAVSQSEVAAVGCHIGRAPKPTSNEITYSREVSRIFQNRCVECHRPGEIGPFSLTSYQDALGWGETIREVVDQGRMPPWFADPHVGKFVNDSRMTDEEKSTIRKWVDAGCPEGDPKDLPEPRQFPEGWNIPTPDLVLKMADKPYQVPAEGVVEYQHFTIDPGFKEDMWMTASEARPGNRSVVHHILVFLQSPKGEVELLRGSLLAAYAPGSPPRMSPKGVAKLIPAGSKIIMQMHYTPNGKPQEDLSTLGLKFCPKSEVTQRVESGFAINFAFAIPPGKKDHKVTSRFVFPEDKLLLSMTPHMHMRGKSFRYEAVMPDGTRELLLDVPHWDFNWQIDYILETPKLMPKGSSLACEAYYDNSPESPTNPDPTKWVKFGEQTWDEMMIGWFTMATLPGRLDEPADAKGKSPAKSDSAAK